MIVRKNILLATILLAAWTSSPSEPRTVNDGVYTEEQADVGEVLYQEHCLLCHDKKYFRPVLKRWEGQPIGVLYTVLSTSMPESNPGFLTEKEYVDITDGSIETQYDENFYQESMKIICKSI